MDMLEVMSQEQGAGEVPELFSDPVWKRSYLRLIMQIMIEAKLPQDPGYTMEELDSGAKSFRAALNRAADIIRSIIQAK
ncbi:hypothetical protein LZ32DRAFT_654435 [Colletotrichum eremochloae]|nr:hypothetical protein LZ32DRAFT_654435 [Colletotrichum eremochloae]